MDDRLSPAHRSPTIYDVAHEAGVAASTVSRAYSRPGRVRSETARRVFAAAERIGYRAGPLVGHRAAPLGGPKPANGPAHKAIGLVIADVTNPFYGDIIKGAYEAAREADYTLILLHTNESPEVERTTIENELPQVDGMVIASSRMTDSALRMVAKQTALVLLNRTIPEAGCVVNDNQRGIRRAAEHLGMLGQDSILYVAGPATSWSDGVRWRALREAAVELELTVRRIGPYGPTILAGYRAARKVADLDATAVLAYNDQRDRDHQGSAPARPQRARGRQRRRLRQHHLRRAGEAGADHGRGAALPDGLHRRQQLHRGLPRRAAQRSTRWSCRYVWSSASPPSTAACRTTLPGPPRVLAC